MKKEEKINSGSSHIAKKKSVQEKTMRLERIHVKKFCRKEEKFKNNFQFFEECFHGKA